MRLLLLTASYPPILGGLQTVAHTLAQRLQHGHDVRVVTNRYPRSLPAQDVLDGVSVQRWLFLTPDAEDLCRGRPDLFLASCYFYPSTLIRLLRLMQTFRPEVVNVHFPDSQLPFVLWLRRRFAFRLVVSLHGHEVERWFEPETDMIADQPNAGRRGRGAAISRLRSILQEADAITACSRYLLDKAIQIEPAAAKGRVIYNGVDLERFHDKTPYLHQRPYILAFGRLTYKKGFDMLLDAFAQVALEHQHVDMILAGEGEERQRLQAQVGRLGLAERVLFFGRADACEVVRLLNGCRFVVVPSRQEPFGIAALEALAAGKPVLATCVGGLVELVQGPGTRLVVPSVAAIRQGLAQWLDRGATSDTILAADRLEQHSWRHVVAQFERVYAEET